MKTYNLRILKFNVDFTFEEINNTYNKYMYGFTYSCYNRKNKIGYIEGVLNKINCVGSITKLFVNNIYRKKGIGSLLIQKCLKDFGNDYEFTLLACNFEEDTKNEMNSFELMRFYERYGFFVVSVCRENETGHKNEYSYFMKRYQDIPEVVDLNLEEKYKRKHKIPILRK